MSTKARLCENCGGKLEVAYAWQRMVVCSTCYQQLSGPPPAAAPPPKSTSLWPVAIAIVMAGVAIGAAMVINHRATVASIAPAVRPVTEPRTANNPAASVTSGLPMDQEDHHRLRPIASAEPAVSQPSSLPAAVAISGVVRRTRKDRSSAPLPDLHVQLLRPTVQRKAFQSCLAAEGRAWKEVADAFGAPSADSSQTNPAGNAAGENAPDPQEIVDGANAAITRVQAASDAAPKELDAADALRTLADVAIFNVPYFDDAVADATLQETVTNAGGKYELSNVAPGDYYLHAMRTGDSTFLEWCVPVHIENDAQTVVDLNSDNATVNHK